MTEKRRTLILATLGGRDVQIRADDGTELKLNDKDLPPALAALGIQGKDYSQRCEYIATQWDKFRDQVILPLLAPVIEPEIEGGHPVTIALVESRQEPGHHLDTWGAAEVARVYLRNKYPKAEDNGLLRFLGDDALIFKGDPSSYDYAKNKADSIVTMLNSLDEIDNIIIAPTGGTPAMSSMLMAAIGGGEGIGSVESVRWAYVPHGKSKAEKVRAPASIHRQAIGRAIARHAGEANFRVAAGVAETYPFPRKRQELTAWLNAHAALFDADYAAAAKSFDRAGRPDGVKPDNYPSRWAERARQLADAQARTGKDQNEADADAQAMLVEQALLRAQALLARGDTSFALLAADAAGERLCVLAISQKLGQPPAEWMPAEAERGALTSLAADHVPDFASWFKGASKNLRGIRNKSHYTHGYGSQADPALVRKVLEGAREHFRKITGSDAASLEGWVGAAKGYVEACLTEDE